MNDQTVIRVADSQKGFPLSVDVSRIFPSLSQLFATCDATTVYVNGTAHYLLAWNSTSGYRVGWLCLPPDDNPSSGLFSEHATLVKSFGGIVERFNEPHTWLLNHNDVLTVNEASYDASFITASSSFEANRIDIPINTSEYYSIAREANGNTTLCHRSTGDILLFASDHAYGHVEIMNGCPPYTLYTIDGVKCFRDWVNVVAQQWLDQTDTTIT
jgi:hypothetical protein